MDSAIGIQGKDFVLLATDAHVNYSVFRLKSDHDKIKVLDSNKLLALSGEAADSQNFGEFIEKNMQLFYYRNGRRPISVPAAASFARSQMAEAIRKAPWNVQCLIGGVDQKAGPQLYWLDYMGTLSRNPFAAQGYANYFVLSILDNYYKKVSSISRQDLSLDEAYGILDKCFAELKKRFLISQCNFLIKVVTKDGITTKKVEI